MLAAPAFRSIPRSEIEYGAESMGQFYSHVYEVVVDGKNDDDANDNVMTKAEARTVLGIDVSAESDAAKKAYRTLSFKLHPDRLVGLNLGPEELAESSQKYARAKLAYETLSSGVRDGSGSWYESLGGRQRTDFFGPISLLPRDAAEAWMVEKKIGGAVAGLGPETATPFIIRNQSC